MSRRITAALLACAILVLAGCGEKAQTAGGPSARKSDAKAWDGTTQAAYSADGLKAGDKAAWEAQLKTRTERGQNEYPRTTSARK
jgi:outer membrane biogenesis lipoprotein LolB